MRPAAVALAFLMSFVSAVAWAGDDTLRCNGRLVSVGDSRFDLLGRCGWPSYQERSREERAHLLANRKAHVAKGKRVMIDVDRWTYDFGPSRFTQLVTLQAGVIVAIMAGERGTAGGADDREAPVMRRARCAPDSLQEGDSSGTLVLRCGEPTLREAWDETLVSIQPVGHDEVLGEAHSEHHEVWTFDFGPDVFVRYVELEDGLVRSVRTGAYGYSL